MSRKPDDEIEHEDTQIFDSKKHPVLKREPARKTGAPPTRPTPTRAPSETPPPLEPQATRVVVMHVPPEALPSGRDRPSQAFVVPRERPSQPIGTPPSEERTRAVEVTPSRRSKASVSPIVEPALAKTVIAPPLFANTVIDDTSLPAQRTMIAEIDAGATSPVLKVPPDLRATLDSNPGLQASFDDGARSSERGAGVLRNPGATESPWDSNSELRRLETNVVSRPDSLGGEHAETNPMAMPIQAMAAHRSTAPMPIPEHTKIGVVERPMIAPTIAPVPPRGKPITTPPSNSAAIAMLDAARVRQIPDRVAHVTPTAMNVAIPEGPGASLRDSGFDHDDDNYHETQERRIDREALRKLPGAAQVIALAVPPVVLDPPSAPAVLTGPPQHSSEPRIEPARPTAPRGGLVWLWMVLAALAIAAAVATAMWYLAS